MNIQAMMKQAQKMQKDMMNKTEEINQMTFVGKSDWVEITFKGNKEVVSVNITNNKSLLSTYFFPSSALFSDASSKMLLRSGV